jgi:hypothetical protein
LSLIAKRTLSDEVSPIRAQNVTPVRKSLSFGSNPSAPPSTDPQPIDTLSTAHTVYPCPVTCMANLLPHRPPPEICSALASPLGLIPASGETASPPAHQAPVRPPARTVM